MSSGLADLKTVYLIYGPEDLLLDQAVDRLRKRLADGAGADLEFNMDVFDGESADAHQIVAAANTLPFMSDRRLVIVRKADKLATDDLGVLADYAKDPNPDTTLVLVAEKIAKNLRIYKAVDSLGGVAEYKAPTKREYPRKVVEMFGERGKRVGIDGAEVLVRAVGYDLRKLAIEMDKVIAFNPADDTLSREDIEQVMSTTAPTSIFDFLDAIGSRDCKQALRLLSGLMSEGESIHGVQAMTLRHVRNLLSTRALVDRRGGTPSPESIAREVGVAPWQGKSLMRQAARFSSDELIDALRDAARTDAEMKTSRDPRLAFERWLVGVCS
ncbi:MAG: DNA polymerase III subunit delta [Actinomycetota bacterium]|nr:DNA polymerase III subunit delta [Actinomycetota bacterium]